VKFCKQIWSLNNKIVILKVFREWPLFHIPDYLAVGRPCFSFCFLWSLHANTRRWMSSKQQQQITESNEIALLKTGLNYNVNLTWDRGTCESLIEVCNTCFQKRSLEWISPFLFVRMAWRWWIDKSNTTSCSDNTDHTQKKNYNSW